MSATSTVGIGPFVMDSVSADRVTLHAFDDYFQGRPSIGRLELMSYPTVRTAWAAMMRGEIDSLYEVGREAADFVRGGIHRCGCTRSTGRTCTCSASTCAGPSSGDRKCGRPSAKPSTATAVLHAVLRDRGQVAAGYVWPSYWAYDRSAPDVRLRSETRPGRRSIGSAFGSGTSRARCRSGSRSPASSWKGCPLFEEMSLVIQKQLYDVGVNMRIEPVSSPNLSRRLATGRLRRVPVRAGERADPDLGLPVLPFADRRLPAVSRLGLHRGRRALDKIRYALTDDEESARASPSSSACSTTTRRRRSSRGTNGRAP